MPPKKQASSLNLPVNRSVSNRCESTRKPIVTTPLPSDDEIPPLWTPSAYPKKVFPEFPSQADLSTEQWYTQDEPFKDPDHASLEEYFYNLNAPAKVIWKRPCEFLPAIVDSLSLACSSTSSTNLHENSKDKGAKKMTSNIKKPDTKKEKMTQNQAKHAHIVHIPEAQTSSGSVHNETGHTDSASTIKSINDVVQAPSYKLHRGFHRKWNTKELRQLALWRQEEARIAQERERREQIYMEFDDILSDFLNGRSARILDEVGDFDAGDLLDEDEDEDVNAIIHSTPANDKSNFDMSNLFNGLMPPPHIEIQGNTVMKPETPHGQVAQSDLASYFHVISDLYDSWCNMDQSTDILSSVHHGNLASTNLAKTGHAHNDRDPSRIHHSPYLWYAIYPQDGKGIPIYNPGGKYLIRLFVLEKWRSVIIDDALPLDIDENILCIASAMQNEIWPCLLAKALAKVMIWYNLHTLLASDVTYPRTKNVFANGYQYAHWVILALTGWRLTSFPNDISHSNQYYEHYIPKIKVESEDNEDTVADGVNDALNIGSPSINKENKRTNSTLLQPRLILCGNIDSDLSQTLTPREISLVTSISGSDNGVLNFHAITQQGTTIISSNAISSNHVNLAVLHPPMPFYDKIIHTWEKKIVSQHESIQKSSLPGNTDVSKTIETHGNKCEENDCDSMVPFDEPPIQFLVVKIPTLSNGKNLEDRLENSNAVGSKMLLEAINDVEQTVHQSHSIILTMTCVHADSHSAGKLNLDNPLRQEDVNEDCGLLVLVEEQHQVTHPPKVYTLRSTSSITLHFERKQGIGHKETVVFRLYPQNTLRYGYSLAVNSMNEISFENLQSQWRRLGYLHIVDSSGKYPSYRPKSWNIMLKQDIELVSPPIAEEIGIDLHKENPSNTENNMCFSVLVDLHVKNDEVKRYLHVYIVNNLNNEVKMLSTLCCKTMYVYELGSAPSTLPLTVIVECTPGNFYIPAGSWTLTVGSNCEFNSSVMQHMIPTIFEGDYSPNNKYLCFRDIISGSGEKNGSWSCRFELLPPANSLSDAYQYSQSTSNECDLITHLAAGLEVRIAETDSLLHNSTSIMATKILQIPNPTSAAKYILQGLIDPMKCHIPQSLGSRRPFRNKPESKISISDSTIVGNEFSNSTTDQLLSVTKPTPSERLKWRLTIWGPVAASLELDQTKEREYETILQKWRETALANHRENVVDGKVSRLLYLNLIDGNPVNFDAGNWSSEKVEAIRHRVQWIEQVAKDDHDVVKEEVPASEDSILYSNPVVPNSESADWNDEELNHTITIKQKWQMEKEARQAEENESLLQMKSFIQEIKTQRAELIQKLQVIRSVREQQLPKLNGTLSQNDTHTQSHSGLSTQSKSNHSTPHSSVTKL